MNEQKELTEDSEPTFSPLKEPTPEEKENIMQVLKEKISKSYQILENCSSRQMKRVSRALLVAGLTTDKPKFSYNHEVELYNLGIEVQSIKLALFNLELEKQKDEEAKKLAESKATSAVAETNIATEVAGNKE